MTKLVQMNLPESKAYDHRGLLVSQSTRRALRGGFTHSSGCLNMASVCRVRPFEQIASLLADFPCACRDYLRRHFDHIKLALTLDPVNHSRIIAMS